ncbi:unnamed protein product [Acanthoscelides obtectus]|uniref:trypsin n=1 Tax=Acanthoscelides obtectus TaxID=200917 RepID=A0A9P0M4W8_ACAOB|nr:unnamed protein product [Acanthoscelides obtectus]CAK1678036.1 hypothetical protein AOBTE_LOCUS31735 [Acanthoscelides obtectus]
MSKILCYSMFAWEVIVFSTLLAYQISADDKPTLLRKPCSEEENFMVIFVNSVDNKLLCVGTLVNNEYVLTAASCSQVWMDQPISVVAGVSKQDLKSLERVHNRSTVSLFTHPNYYLITHDLMMVQLDEPIDETHNVKYVKLPWGTQESLETACARPTLLGWSMRSKAGAESESSLLCADLKLYPLDQCKQDYKTYPDLEIDNKTMCTKTDKMDACYGDSGAPLMCGGIQYGVVTFGLGCANELPGVYTRVDQHMDFIKDVLDGNIEPRIPAGKAEGLRGVVAAMFSVVFTFLYLFVHN